MPARRRRPIPEVPEVPASAEDYGPMLLEGGGEASEEQIALLADIDRLYGELLSREAGEGSNEAAEYNMRQHMPNAAQASHASVVPQLACPGSAGAVTGAVGRGRPAPQGHRGRPKETRHQQELSALQADKPVEEEEEEEVSSLALLGQIDSMYQDVMHTCSMLGSGLPTEDDMSLADLAAEDLMDLSDQVDVTVASADGSFDEFRAERREMRTMLEEVLWTGLLLGRGADCGFDVQSLLFTALPAARLASAHWAATLSGELSPSLLQRLSAELPQVHAALKATPGTEDSVSSLEPIVREARDTMLSLACSASSGLGGGISSVRPKDISEPKKAKAKPRRTSLSHWTSSALEDLEAPKGGAVPAVGRRR